MSERTLVTVETITALAPIPDADAIEVARVRGWEVVVKKGEVAIGDQVLYFEIDSALPLDDARFAFLAERGEKEIEGRRVHVLKTARLRGAYSQGLVIALADFPEVAQFPEADIAGLLGVVKWDPPLPDNVAAIGPFPSFVRKTDVERVQNLTDEAWDQIQEAPEEWLAMEKVDGWSATIWRTRDGVLHAASRRWELDPEVSNPMWSAIEASGIAEHLAPGEWVQAEVAGPGVMRNPLRLPGLRLFVFGYGTFGDFPVGDRFGYGDWPQWARDLSAPVVDWLVLPESIAEASAQVREMMSLVSPGCLAEGVVWTHAKGVEMRVLDSRHVFKAISARYLTKHGG